MAETIDAFGRLWTWDGTDIIRTNDGIEMVSPFPVRYMRIGGQGSDALFFCEDNHDSGDRDWSLIWHPEGPPERWLIGRNWNGYKKEKPRFLSGVSIKLTAGLLRGRGA